MGIAYKNKIRALIKELDKDKSISHISPDVFEILDVRIKNIVNLGIHRAKENKRRTLQGKDI